MLTTMHLPDFKDQAGNRERGRRTIPLVLGDLLALWMSALFIVVWSWVCLLFWDAPGWLSLALVLFGSWIALRVVRKRSHQADSRSWRLWSLWTAALYTLPLACQVRAIG